MNLLTFSITIIGRRSNKHAGARYFKRGLNEEVYIIINMNLNFKLYFYLI